MEHKYADRIVVAKLPDVKYGKGHTVVVAKPHNGKLVTVAKILQNLLGKATPEEPATRKVLFAGSPETLRALFEILYSNILGTDLIPDTADEIVARIFREHDIYINAANKLPDVQDLAMVDHLIILDVPGEHTAAFLKDLVFSGTIVVTVELEHEHKDLDAMTYPEEFASIIQTATNVIWSKVEDGQHVLTHMPQPDSEE